MSSLKINLQTRNDRPLYFRFFVLYKGAVYVHETDDPIRYNDRLVEIVSRPNVSSVYWVSMYYEPDQESYLNVDEPYHMIDKYGHSEIMHQAISEGARIYYDKHIRVCDECCVEHVPLFQDHCVHCYQPFDHIDDLFAEKEYPF